MYHAHIDCTHGLSAQSLYKACQLLAQEVKTGGVPPADALDDEDPTSLLSKWGLPRTNHQGRFLHNDQVHWTKILQTQADQSSIRANDAKENTRLPMAVLLSSIQALKCWTRYSGEASTSPSDETPIELAIFGSIWWFHRLGFNTSISCTPLPCCMSAITERPDLYKGLPIALTENIPGGDTKFTHDGLVALKAILSMANPATTGQTSPPPMMLRFIATGLDSATIVVGQRLEPTDISDMQRHDRITKSDDSLDQSTLWEFDHNLSLLETNVDDTTAEHLSFAAEILMQHVGVADCWVTPIVMKKGRPAHTLHCLCHNEHCAAVLQLLFRHVPTLGVRVQSQEYGLGRVALRRSTVSVPFRAQDVPSCPDGLPCDEYVIDCKVAYLGADIVSIKAEFDQCKRIAMAMGAKIPVSRIRALAVEKARNSIAQDSELSGVETI